MASSPRYAAATRLLRLSVSSPDELAAALHAYGADGASLGLPPPPSPPPPGAVLDAVFAALAPPRRAPLPPAPPPPHARPALPAARIADDPALVRAVLAHPPRSVPRGAPAAPAVVATQQPATAIAVPTVPQPAPPLRQVPQNVPGPLSQRAQPPVPAKPAALPAKPTAPPRRRVPTAEPDGPEMDVDRELDFEASLARDVAARAQREDRKRPRFSGGHAGSGGGARGYDSFRERGDVRGRRGAVVVSDEEEDDEGEDRYRSGHGSRADRELNRTLASNPYNAAFNASKGGSAPGFRTASSKLAADRRAAGKRPRYRRGDDGDGGGRGEVGSDGDDVVRTVHRAVLGPARRPKFNAPRSNAAKKKEVQQEEDETTRDDLPEIPNIEPKLVEMIMNEALDKSPNVQWDDIAGLHFAKKCVQEAVIFPMLRPDIFTGLRGPPKGLLLFGPPGTGKTVLAKTIATEAGGAKFFSISASSLMSKWVGEGEKMVRALFAVARALQPSIVFIDEIDSLLTQRSEADQESSRRVKTEFLVQMDGAATSRDDRVLLIGATNRPAELDEAARRRMVKRLYIPLPDDEAREYLVRRLLKEQRHDIDDEGFSSIVDLTKGYSGSDLYALCAEAALGPVRNLGSSIGTIDASKVRPISVQDFRAASKSVRASVAESDLEGYKEWNETFGSFEHEPE